MGETMRKVESAVLRRVMSEFATGVTVVTARHGETIHGLTANAFCSVSLQPALVLVCIDKQAHSHGVIVAGRCFAVNLLSAKQREIAERFANDDLQSAERFAGISHHVEVTGAPVFDHTLGWLDCQVVANHEAGDHTIFVGEVVALANGAHEPPLLFFRNGYRDLAAE